MASGNGVAASVAPDGGASTTSGWECCASGPWPATSSGPESGSGSGSGSLGWQLQPAAGLLAPEPKLPELELEPEPELDPELAPDPDPDPDPGTEADQASGAQQHQSDVAEAPPSGAPDAATPLPEATDFQALTKAQIIEHCSTIHGVELDGSQTKAELVEQARALESQHAQLICPPLPDGLVDDPLI